MSVRPPFEMTEGQILATYNRSVDEMLFYRKHEWQVTNYAIIAYAALLSAPLLVEEGCLRTLASWCAFGLVWLVAIQAWRTLSYYNDIRILEGRRLREAIKHLGWMTWIEVRHPPKGRSKRRWLVRKVAAMVAWLRGKTGPQGADDVLFPLGLAFAVGLGALFASLIILSRFSWWQRVIFWICQVIPWIGQSGSLMIGHS